MRERSFVVVLPMPAQIRASGPTIPPLPYDPSVMMVAGNFRTVAVRFSRPFPRLTLAR
jgi:hypothetical protein